MEKLSDNYKINMYDGSVYLNKHDKYFCVIELKSERV